MPNPSNRITELSEKIDALVKKQESFQNEILELSNQLKLIQIEELKSKEISTTPVSINEVDNSAQKEKIPQNIVEIFDAYKGKQQTNISKSVNKSFITPKKLSLIHISEPTRPY